MDTKQNNASVFHSLSNPSSFSLKFVALFVVIIGVGVFSGYLLAAHKTSSNSNSVSSSSSATVEKGALYGSGDTATFKDMAEGVMTEGGIAGEGQFHLVRPGGDSQNVYLTSSLVDLSLFIGRKVKVWGQTQTAKKAGWLMDVGKVEVEN